MIDDRQVWRPGRRRRRARFRWGAALGFLLVSAWCGLVAHQLLPDLFSDVPPLLPPGDGLGIVGWLIVWPIWLLASYEGLGALLMCVLGPLAVIDLYVKWRRRL